MAKCWMAPNPCESNISPVCSACLQTNPGHHTRALVMIHLQNRHHHHPAECATVLNYSQLASATGLSLPFGMVGFWVEIISHRFASNVPRLCARGRESFRVRTSARCSIETRVGRRYALVAHFGCYAPVEKGEPDPDMPTRAARMGNCKLWGKIKAHHQFMSVLRSACVC